MSWPVPAVPPAAACGEELDKHEKKRDGEYRPESDRDFMVLEADIHASHSRLLICLNLSRINESAFITKLHRSVAGYSSRRGSSIRTVDGSRR
jgi:hypothetical protein